MVCCRPAGIIQVRRSPMALSHHFFQDPPAVRCLLITIIYGDSSLMMLFVDLFLTIKIMCTLRDSHQGIALGLRYDGYLGPMIVAISLTSMAHSLHPTGGSA